MLFNDMEVVLFNTTLTTAHKIKDKLEKLAVPQSAPLRGRMDHSDVFPVIEIPQDLLFSKEPEDLEEYFKGKWEDFLENKRFEFAVKSDLNSVKEAIFHANIRCGVSELLNEKKQLELEKNHLSAFDVSFSESEDITETAKKLRDYYKDKDAPFNGIRIKHLFFDPEELRNRIKSINKSVMEIEESITELNAKSKVEFSIYEVTAEKLGLT